MTSKTTVFRGNVVVLDVESVELPNGQQLDMEIIRHPGGAAVAAINDKDELCLLRQYRHAVGGWLWEIPAGKLEPDETPMSTAVRELEEEAGIKANHWESLGNVIPTPGICDEEIHLFLARDLQEVPINHEPTEIIEVHWLPIDAAVEQIHEGTIRDAKTALCVLLAVKAIGKQ